MIYRVGRADEPSFGILAEKKVSDNAVDKDFADYIFKRYQKPITRYLIKHSCSREDAEDILQETYIRIVNSQGLEQLEDKAKGYIFKVAINIWRDKIRKDSTRENYRSFEKNQESIVEDINTRLNPDVQAQHNQDLNRIKGCLLEVSNRQRKVFLLRALKDLTFMEIARVLKVSTKTVQRDYFCTLALCKERLGK